MSKSETVSRGEQWPPAWVGWTRPRRTTTRRKTKDPGATRSSRPHREIVALKQVQAELERRCVELEGRLFQSERACREVQVELAASEENSRRLRAGIEASRPRVAWAERVRVVLESLDANLDKLSDEDGRKWARALLETAYRA